MSVNQNALTRLLQLSDEIHEQAKAIHSNMENNEAEQLETLQLLFEKREFVIKQFDTYMQQTGFQWTQENRNVIHKLHDYEQKLQPLINSLHLSFLTQMDKISQTKQVSKKYMGAYQNSSTEGSFIDKRK